MRACPCSDRPRCARESTVQVFDARLTEVRQNQRFIAYVASLLGCRAHVPRSGRLHEPCGRSCWCAGDVSSCAAQFQLHALAGLRDRAGSAFLRLDRLGLFRAGGFTTCAAPTSSTATLLGDLVGGCDASGALVCIDRFGPGPHIGSVLRGRLMTIRWRDGTPRSPGRRQSAGRNNGNVAAAAWVEQRRDVVLVRGHQMLASQGVTQRLWPPTAERVRSGDGRVM